MGYRRRILQQLTRIELDKIILIYLSKIIYGDERWMYEEGMRHMDEQSRQYYVL